MNKLITTVATAILLPGFLLMTCSNMPKKKKVEVKPTYDLKWKVAENDTILYPTELQAIKQNLFDSTFGSEFIKDSASLSEMTKFADKMTDMAFNRNVITRMYNSPVFDDAINIELVMTPKEPEMEGDSADTSREMEMERMMQQMMTGVQLRGSVNPDGSLYSFWVQSKQKNLLSIMFELPTHPVEVGEIWSLKDVNFIGNDQNFVCTEAEKRNMVTLTEIIVTEGDTIAILDYDILESVKGDFNMPDFMGMGGVKKTTMDFTFKGRGEFSITQGRWKLFQGIMTAEMSGFSTSSVSTKIVMRQ